MKDIQQQVTQALMERYQEIVGEDPYERWPGVFFPQVLVEYVEREPGVLQLTCHIGVETDKEDLIAGIEERLNLVLHELSLTWTLHDAGEGPIVHVAVNTKEQYFLQKPVHWVLSKRKLKRGAKKFVL